MNIKEQKQRELQNLVAEYERDLTFLHNRNMDTFDTTMLPDIIQDMVKLAVNKTPAFSNIAALAVTNFVLSSMFGQLRPTIDDFMYSDDSLGVNAYSILLAKSGQGKDSTYQAISKACNSALKHIDKLKQDEAEAIAREEFIRSMSKDNPQFDASAVVKEDYMFQIPKIERPISTLASSRGGITTSLNKMAKSEFGTKSIFASELAMAIQTSPFVMEVLELLAASYDMGKVEAAEFKTDDAKEESIDKLFLNFLGISSPAPFYQDGPVRKLLVPMLKTAFARRCIIIFSQAKEEFENKYIPQTPEEKRVLKAEARVLVRELTASIDKQMLAAVQALQFDKSIMFDEEAAAIYDDYKSYTESLADLLLLNEGDSVEGIEISGKAFKMGRIAALWTLAQNKRIVDKPTMLAAIYFVDHSSIHLKRFAATLELKPYQIFATDWEQGFLSERISTHEMIQKGYLTTKQINKPGINGFLSLVNSHLEGKCTVTYNEHENAFIFIPVVLNTDNLYSCRAVKGHTDDKPIVNVLANKQLKQIGQLLTMDSSINPFADDTTKLIMFTVSESFLTAAQLHKYLEFTHHFIAVPDSVNPHSFTVVIPTNSVVSKSEYKFVAMSIAQQLLLSILPEHCEHHVTYYGHAGSELLQSTDDAALFDVSGILGSYAAGNQVQALSTKLKSKPTKPQIDKYIESEILEHRNTIVDILNISTNRLLVLAGIVWEMKMNYVSDEKVGDVIAAINSSLEESIPQNVLQQYIIEPFRGV